MGTFGDKLRRERELRAVTLDEIAEATKIGTRSLKALEEEQFEQLPGGIFNKGFVRAYAKYLGINEEQAVADYVSAVEKASGTSGEGPSDEVVVASIAKKRSEPEKKIGVDDGGSSKVWVSLAVVALVAAAGYSSWKYYEQRKTEKAEQASIQMQSAAPPATATQAIPQTETVPAGTIEAAPGSNAASTEPSTKASAPAESANTPAANEFTLTLRAVEDVWVQVDADGSTEQATITASSEKTIHAKDKVVMKIGKPGALEVSFNGTPVGPLGPPDRVVTKTFTSGGMQQ